MAHGDQKRCYIKWVNRQGSSPLGFWSQVLPKKLNSELRGASSDPKCTSNSTVWFKKKTHTNTNFCFGQIWIQILALWHWTLHLSSQTFNILTCQIRLLWRLGIMHEVPGIKQRLHKRKPILLLTAWISLFANPYLNLFLREITEDRAIKIDNIFLSLKFVRVV